MFSNFKTGISVYLFLLISTISFGADYYWVGGTGNWSDISHWATTSGGSTFHFVVPTANDNVHFDANSFTAPGQIVIISDGGSKNVVVCRDMDWAGALNNPTLTGNSSQILRIYGSIRLIDQMNFSFLGQVYFEATTLGHTITSAGQSFHNSIYFQGMGGGWTLQDSLTVSYENNSLSKIYLVYGNLNTNAKTIRCPNFNSNYPGNLRTLTIDYSETILQNNNETHDRRWEVNGDNLTLNATGSKISGHHFYHYGEPKTYGNIFFIGNDCFVYGGASTFQTMTIWNTYPSTLARVFENNIVDSLITFGYVKILDKDSIHVFISNGVLQLNDPNSSETGHVIGKAIFSGNSNNIYRSNQFDTLICSPGKIISLEQNKTQFINDSLCVRGNNCYPIIIRSTENGTQANISKPGGIVSGDFMELRDINATGGATFYAGSYSTNLSNNTGWIFTNSPGYIYGLGPDTSICIGDRLGTFNFNGAYAYLWQNGSTLPYFTINAPGTYWVTATYATNCNYTDTIVVDTLATPVSVAGNNQLICHGDAINLNGQASGGILPYQYQWTPSAGLSNDTIINPTATPMNTTNYIFRVTGSNGCDSRDTVLIQVNPDISLTVTGVNPTTCNSSTGSATANPSGGTPFLVSPFYSFVWTTNPVQTTPTATGLAAGIYFVTITDSAGCTRQESIALNDPGTPVINLTISADSACYGDNVILTGSGADLYEFFIDGISQGTPSPSTTLIVNSIPAGLHAISLEGTSAGCTASTPGTDLMILQANTVEITITASSNPVTGGTPVTFTASPVNGGNAPIYQWLVNDIPVGTNSVTYTYTPSNGDIVQCILTSDIDCPSNNPDTANAIIMQVGTSNPCPGIPTVDYGGQTYNTVQIGTQCWLRENLNIGTRVDGSVNQTNNGIIEKYCYNDIEDSCSVYGGLYQWDEMMGYSASSFYTPSCRQGICPSGWHLPSMAEWDTLIDYLGGGSVAGGLLKETGIRYWQAPNSGATNQSGFSAFGGGYRIGAGGFAYLGPYAYYYTSTEDNSINTFCQRLFYDTPVISPNTGTKLMGASVRCLKDYCPVTTVSNAGQDQMELTASCTILNANSPGSQETGTWTIVAGSGGNFDNVNDPVTRFEGTYATSYILKWMITNCCGNSSEDMVTIEILPEPGIPCPGTPSVTYGGQIYHTVQIENQCWLKENLNIGTMIDGATDQTDNGILEKYCFDNDPGNCNVHGGLYQWNELMQYTTSSNNLPSGRQGICPPGWHIPGRAEWDTLIMHTGGESIAGGPLKEMGYCRWSPPNAGANNSTGFTALPGGIRWPGGGFDYLLSYAFIYTATEDNSMNAWSRRLFHNTTVSSENTGSKAMSASVRCVKDTCYNYSTVGITISVNQNPVCNDDTVSFTATPFNGGLNPVFQWKVNAIDQGLNSPSFSYIPLNNDQVICILLSDETCVTGNPDTSNAITITVNPLLPISVSIAASNDTVCYGDTVTYTPSVTNGGNSITYHWFVNDSLVSGSLPCNILNNGLVACYPFNGNANDETSNGNHGTVVGASLTSDRFGNANSAYYFNGIDNYIVMDADSLPTAERTVSLWFNAISVENHPVTLAYGGYSCGQSWFEGINHGGPKYVLESHCEGNLIEATYTDEPIGQWYHWVITTDSAGSKIYINGSVVSTDNIFVNDTYVSGKDLAIGVCVAPWGIAPYTDPNVGYFNGKIDDIRIYDRALTASEVFILYNSVDSSFSYVPFNGDSVYCIAFSSDPCAVNNPDTSNIIVMSVTPNLPVSVTITASENPVCQGTSVTYTAIQTNGGSAPAYQWQVNGSNVGTNSSNYSYTPANGDVVTCILTSNVTCATGSPATSNPITMTVNSNLPVSVTITASENPACSGTAVSFTAFPVNGGTAPVYQWQVNGTNTGSNSPAYTYVPGNGDLVLCTVTSNENCSTGNPAKSNVIEMEVNPVLPVSLTINLPENPVCAGSEITVTASPVNGGTSPVYQWQLNSINIGSNTPTLTFIPQDGDEVKCLLTSSLPCSTEGFVVSNVIIIGVLPLVSPTIFITPSENPVCSGGTVTLTATITHGGTSPVYLWKVNGTIVGINTPVITIIPSDGDIITCELTSNEVCTISNSVISNPVTMGVTPLSTVGATITANPEGPVCEGAIVNYSAMIVNGGSIPVYQWRVNGVNVGSNSSQFSYSPSNHDEIICEVLSNANCVNGNPALSNTIWMTVNPYLPVSVNIASVSPVPLCSGSTVTITAIATNAGTSPVFEWKVNNIPTGINTPEYFYVPTNGDQIQCILTSNINCPSGNPASSNILNMEVIPISTVSLTITAAQNPLCAGATATITAFAVNGGNAPVYQWKVNGVITGNSTSQLNFLPVESDVITCVLISNGSCVTGNPAISNELVMHLLDKPVVTLNGCPLVTTNASRPFPLKGGLPLGGMYFGDCVQGGMFHPSLLPGAQSQTNIMYTYTNIHLCSDTAIQQITVLPSNSNFSCGESFTDVRDNRIYTTQLIGNKCWMRENLNYGIQVTQIHQQNDNCIPEKYCFINNENNCTLWGGLYQWNELMQYSVIEPVQGLCPPEWHIATALEWESMVLALGGPGNAGDSLKSGANSNFIALFSGLLYQNTLYAFPDEGTFFWTSTILNAGKSIARGINIINPSVSRYHSNHSNAFSTRCIKD